MLIRIRVVAVVIFLAFVNASCASYRVVPFTRGVDLDGNVRDFYAVVRNNTIIPEYVINERGEYPTDPKVAWQRFKQRRDKLEPEMIAKYKIQDNFSYVAKSAALGTAYSAVFPVTYPLYYFGSAKGTRSPQKYFDLMVHGSSPREPESKDELKNF